MKQKEKQQGMHVVEKERNEMFKKQTHDEHAEHIEKQRVSRSTRHRH